MSERRVEKPIGKDQRGANAGLEGNTPALTHQPSLTTPSRNPRTLHTQLRVGDHARLKKPHPCGGSEWEVLRLGAEVKFRCLGCGRIVSLPRAQLSSVLRAIIRPDDEADAGGHGLCKS